jgi:hypothetical protein
MIGGEHCDGGGAAHAEANVPTKVTPDLHRRQEAVRILLQRPIAGRGIAAAAELLDMAPPGGYEAISAAAKLFSRMRAPMNRASSHNPENTIHP